MENTWKAQIQTALCELLQHAHAEQGDLVVIGCSSSEIVGDMIGKNSNPDAAAAVVSAVLPLLEEKGLYLAAQCCEHLNRALIVEKAYAKAAGLPIVNAVPQKKAGGSFATAAYAAMTEPVAVEHVQAQAGLDIGDTFIGMHLADVAVPVRLSVREVGKAHLTAAYVRPKYIGGERAVYNNELQ